MWYETLLGIGQFLFLMFNISLYLVFILHVIYTPDENKIREIIRDEIRKEGEKDDVS